MFYYVVCGVCAVCAVCYVALCDAWQRLADVANLVIYFLLRVVLLLFFLVVVVLIWRLSFLCLVAEAKAAGHRSCRKVWLLGRVECQKTKKGPYPCGIQSFQNAFKQMRAITYADRGP